MAYDAWAGCAWLQGTNTGSIGNIVAPQWPEQLCPGTDKPGETTQGIWHWSGACRKASDLENGRSALETLPKGPFTRDTRAFPKEGKVCNPLVRQHVKTSHMSVQLRYPKLCIWNARCSRACSGTRSSRARIQPSGKFQIRLKCVQNARDSTEISKIEGCTHEDLSSLLDRSNTIPVKFERAKS